MAKKNLKMSKDAQEIYRQMSTYVGAEEMFRKEYSDLRALLNKRIDRSQAAGFQENVEKFSKLSSFKAGKGKAATFNRRAFAIELAQARQYYEDPLSTAAGRAELEEKIIAKLHEHKFTEIDKSNFKSFRKFMKAMDDKYIEQTPDGKKKKYDSDKAVEFFESLESSTQKQTSSSELMEMYNIWLSHQPK